MKGSHWKKRNSPIDSLASIASGGLVEMEFGVPHILVPEEEIFTFKWWDGDFIADECEGFFDDLTEDRVGPLD